LSLKFDAGLRIYLITIHFKMPVVEAIQGDSGGKPIFLEVII
jgi:hypothetical protein